MPTDESLSSGYFDAVYAAKSDPWNFETSDYEREKYRATLAALPSPRYRRAFEIGCSIGVLTAMLAPRCDDLLAVDVTESALAQARRRLAEMPQVRIEKMAVPATFPSERFDLIVLSEVGYYWSAADLALACSRMLQALEAGGQLLLVHWTPPVHDYPLTGDAVHDHFLAEAAHAGFSHPVSRREENYRLDLLVR